MPKLLLGFIVILAVLIGLTFQNPATTLCTIQMAEVNKRLQKGFYTDDKRGSFQKGVKSAYNLCLESNSPGGCHDMFTRFDYLEQHIKTISTECGQDDSTATIKKMLEKALRLFVKIGWGEKPPINKYNKTAWLDTSDLGLYCRLKRQYQRLYGRETWNQFVGNFLPELPESQTITKKERWGKCLFSYPCKGLY